MAGHEGNPDALRQWFEDGADGAIDWGSPGDFDACVEIASKYMDDAEGYCNLRHQAAVGGPPGSEGKRMNQMVYKTLRPEMKAVDNAPNDFMITLSMESVDRDGDTIDPNGWNLDHYKRHPIVVSSHEYGDLRKQIGEIDPESLHVVKGALRGKVTYYANEGNDEATWAAKLAAKNRAAYSVGFVPEEDEPIKGGGRHYVKQELLELSHVIVPSNRDALQLMAKSVKAGPVADIVNELLTEEPRRKDGPAQCAVSGCDDMSSAHVGVCADHLKMLTALQPNPTVYGRGFEPDDIDYFNEVLVIGKGLRRLHKAGRTISAANLGKLHTAMDNIHAVHDGACKDDSCPYNDDGTDGNDGTTAGYRRRAMGEGSASAGGVTVNEETGTHGASDEDITHSHDHPANGFQGEDGLHDHEPHDHPKGTADHGHPHADVTIKAPQSTADQNDLPDSAFAAILPGGTKDADGKTTPRSLRKLSHHKADGSIDLPHLKDHKNALARISQRDMPADLKAKAQSHLDAHAKAEGIGQAAEDGGKSGAALLSAIEKAAQEAWTTW